MDGDSDFAVYLKTNLINSVTNFLYFPTSVHLVCHASGNSDTSIPNVTVLLSLSHQRSVNQ